MKPDNYPITLNFYRDIEDNRDIPYMSSTLDLPLFNYSLLRHVREIENQGNIGACTGNAGVSAMEILFKANNVDVNLSRLFAYYINRLMDGMQDKDGGAYTRSVFKAFNKFGLPTEEDYPYDVSKVNVRPPEEIFCKAQRIRVLKYERVQDTLSLKVAISNGLPVLIGMALGQKFKNIRGNHRDHINQYYPVDWSSHTENRFIGGHAMVAVAYDEEGVMLENSWGTGWGDNGIGKVSWRVFQADVWDMWVATAVEYKRGWFWNLYYKLTNKVCLLSSEVAKILDIHR